MTGLSWLQRSQVFSATNDPYFVSAANQVNLYTVAFATATNGIYGGEYTPNFGQNPVLKRMSELYLTPTDATQTVIHEYAHYAAKKYSVVGDDIEGGYSGLGPQMTPYNQREALREAINVPGTTGKFKNDMVEGYINQGNLSWDSEYPGSIEVITVEGGYLLEKLVFGTIIHRPGAAIEE